MTIFPRVLELLKEKGAGDILLFGGGIIPPEDMAELQKHGIGRLFGPGTPTTEIVDYTEADIQAVTAQPSAGFLSDRLRQVRGQRSTGEAPDEETLSYPRYC